MLSGNTVGRTFYSDLHFDALMWYKEVSIIHCVRCQRFVWVRNMKEYEPQGRVRRFIKCLLDFLPPFRVPLFVSKTKPLTLQELTEALASDAAEVKEDELDLRYALWHRFNDRIRKNLFGFKKTPEEKASKLWKNEEEKRLWNENLNSLFNLLDAPNPYARLIQAEICREQGEFNRAMVILNGITGPEFKKHVRIKRRHCRDNDPFVCVIDGPFLSIGEHILMWVCMGVYWVVCMWTFTITLEFFNGLFGNEI